MTTKRAGSPFALAAVVAAACLQAAGAAESTSTAWVKADRTNVRAKPSFDGEVLGSLKKGEAVVVIERVTGLGADGTPRPWERIRLPGAVAVWVYGPLVDKAKHSVKSEHLNLRAGPGKNYSAIGELARGSSVVIVRESDDWLQIEPPAGAFAFVASSLVDTNGSAEIAPAKTAAGDPALKSRVEPPVQTHSPTATPPGPSEASAPLVQPATEAAAPAGDANAAAVATPSTAGKPAESRGPARVGSPRDLTWREKPPKPSTARPRAAGISAPAAAAPRVVLRQGIVRESNNIQSPGYYELSSLHGEGLIDFLVIENPGIEVGRYLNRAVTLEGDEWRDSRWKTPLVKVRRIDPLY